MPDAPQTVTLSEAARHVADEIQGQLKHGMLKDSDHFTYIYWRQLIGVLQEGLRAALLDAGGAAERGEPVAWVVMDKDGKRYAVDFSREEAERVCEAVNRYKSPVYSLNDPFYGPFTVRPLIFGDAARRASTAPQEGGEKP